MPRDAAALRLDGQPRLPRAAPASGARRRSRSSRRAAHRSRSGARRRVAADPRGREASCARRSTISAWSAGRRRRARAASTSTCASSGAGRSTRCAAPRWRSRARSSGARRDLATSKWWKEERHGVFLDYNQNAKDRTIASAYSVRPTPDARVSAPLTWDEIDDCEPADFTLATMPARFAAARRSPRRHRRASVLARARCSSCRRGRSATARATRRGRRTTGSRPASRRACSRRSGARPRVRRSSRRKAEASADRDRPRAEERGRARRPRALEGAPPRSGGASASRPTCSSTRCAAASDLDAHPRQPAARPGGAAPGAGTARSRRRRRTTGAGVDRRRPGAEDLRELVRRRDLELIVAAVRRLLVEPPALEDRGVAEPRALHVVVLHLADALDPQRLPRQILAGAPAALAAGHPRSSRRRTPRPTRATDARPAPARAAAPAPRRAPCASPS